MFNPSKSIFFTFTLTGTLISISANSWLLAWVGMEMNIMGFIPMMISYSNKNSTEAAMKYFFVQAISSSILMISVIYYFQFYMKTNPLILLALWVKLGVAPFHFWLPSTIEALSTFPMFMVLTWQKITPLFLLSNMNMNSNQSLIPIMASAMWGSLSGISQTSVKKIITFSSISHMAWLMSSISMSQNITLIYFFAYTMVTGMILYSSYTLNVNHINQMMFLNKKEKIIMFTLLLSLGGLPPFVTFFPKLMILINLVQNLMLIIMAMLMISSMTNLYFYLRWAYPSLTINHFNNQQIISKSFMPLMITLTLVTPAMMILI